MRLYGPACVWGGWRATRVYSPGAVEAHSTMVAEEGGADMEGAAPAEQPEGAGPAQVAKRQRRRGP